MEYQTFRGSDVREALSLLMTWHASNCARESLDQDFALASRMFHSDAPAIVADAIKAPIRSYAIFPFSNCVRVGLLGACTDLSNPLAYEFSNEMAEDAQGGSEPFDFFKEFSEAQAIRDAQGAMQSVLGSK